MNIPLIITLLVLAVAAGVFYYKSKSPAKAAAIGISTGVISLGIAKLVLGFFGVVLSFNLYALAASAILGVPGTLLQIVFKFLWHG